MRGAIIGVAGLFLGIIAATAHAMPDERDMMPDSLVQRIFAAADESPQVKLAKADEENGAPARLKAIEEAATVYGMQGGRVTRWRWLLARTSERSRELDRAFPFHVLLLDGGKLQPPVLDAGEDVSRIADNGKRLMQVRKVYRVKVSARFVHVPLGWRNFLVPQHMEAPRMPRETLLPRNEAERKVWAVTVGLAWRKGTSVASEEYRMRVAAMEAAFSGMVLYDMLAMRGMIAPPEVKRIEHSPAEVGANGTRLAVGNREEVVNREAYFVGNINQWHPVDLTIPEEFLH